MKRKIHRLCLWAASYIHSPSVAYVLNQRSRFAQSGNYVVPYLAALEASVPQKQLRCCTCGISNLEGSRREGLKQVIS